MPVPPASWLRPDYPPAVMVHPNASYVQMGRRARGSVASLVWGICALLSATTLGIPFGVLAVWMGARARRNLRYNPLLRGRAMANTGTILGVIGLLVGTLTLALVLALRRLAGIGA